MHTVTYNDELSTHEIQVEDYKAVIKVIDMLRDSPLDLDIFLLDDVEYCIWTLEKLENHPLL